MVPVVVGVPVVVVEFDCARALAFGSRAIAPPNVWPFHDRPGSLALVALVSVVLAVLVFCVPVFVELALAATCCAIYAASDELDELLLELLFDDEVLELPRLPSRPVSELRFPSEPRLPSELSKVLRLDVLLDEFELLFDEFELLLDEFELLVVCPERGPFTRDCTNVLCRAIAACTQVPGSRADTAPLATFCCGVLPANVCEIVEPDAVVVVVVELVLL